MNKLNTMKEHGLSAPKEIAPPAPTIEGVSGIEN
jgi:hypothetical protein